MAVVYHEGRITTPSSEPPIDTRPIPDGIHPRAWRARSAAAVAGALTLAAAGPAWSHGLAERYRLPLPLWLYLAGAGGVVALSFVLVAALARRDRAPRDAPSIDLPTGALATAVVGRVLAMTGRLASVAVLGLVVVAGLAGSQSPFHNIAPVLVWVIWWVGLGFTSALAGDVWVFLDPWRILFGWAERARGVFLGRAPRPPRRWPRWLGMWPAALLFLAFAWMELIWPSRDRPRSLALAVIAYSGLTWLGMRLFGREPWRRGADPFAAAFGLLARLGPTEMRVTGRAACRECAEPDCAAPGPDCAGCLDCHARAAPAERGLGLRAPGAGLLVARPISPSLLSFVLMMLSTVTFDGLTETPAWAAVQTRLLGVLATLSPGLAARDPAAHRLVLTAGLLLTPLAFAACYAACARLMAAAAGQAPGGQAPPATVTTMRWFALTFLPIAFAYHVAHYLPLLLLAGQLVIPLASDPLGLGWDLFGTALYRIDVGILSPRAIWYTAVLAIVAGHVLAVRLAHLTALRAFGNRRRALRSQYPMLVFMVTYTMLSLWILAQPVTDRR